MTCKFSFVGLLYFDLSSSSTFTPQLPLVTPPRPITTDDLERDRVLSQRIALFGWLEEKHLDVPEGEGGKGFLMFAEQGSEFLFSTCEHDIDDARLSELLKINHYKAPRDKLICILNCCKVIFGLLFLVLSPCLR